MSLILIVRRKIKLPSKDCHDRDNVLCHAFDGLSDSFSFSFFLPERFLGEDSLGIDYSDSP
jgi:hypothetical protein